MFTLLPVARERMWYTVDL